MPHKRIGITGLPDTGGVYSAAVVAGQHCYLSGQLPIDPATSELAGGGVAGQTRQALSNLFTALGNAGFSIEELVFVDVLLADIGTWDEMNDAYREVFGGSPLPARMAVGAGGLPRGSMVEIAGVAVRSSPD
jgi:2-iminobutanoate/2-iminopropanoate deaminase